jgi:hypothetical protein
MYPTWRVFLLHMYIRRISDHACSPLNEYPYEPRHHSELVCNSHIGLATVPGAPKPFITAPIVCWYQSSDLAVPQKAGRNDLLGSDSLLKLILPSLLSASSHTLLEAPPD